MFRDRRDAGDRLSERLEKFKGENVLVLAVPRGGVVTAYASIKNHGFQWDLIIPRKIGAPHNKEVAIGAVASDGTYFTDERYVDMLGVPEEYIEKEVEEQVREIKRRLRDYRGDETFPYVAGKTVIIVDDGIATGFTILAAVKSVQKQGAAKTILAVPVGPRETIDFFEDIADEVICLEIPEEFYAVGLHYQNFGQTEDEEVFEIIKELRR